MIERVYETTNDWLVAREGTFTGTKISALKAKPRTTGVEINDKVYNNATIEMVAGVMTTPDGIDTPWKDDRQRGLMLEWEALQALADRFPNMGIKKLDRTIWFTNESELIGSSPDGISTDGETAIETKCLSSVKHLTYYIEHLDNNNTPPKEFKEQVIQYFVCHDKIKRVMLAFYDPRFNDEQYQMFVIILKREDYEKEIREQIELLQEGLRNAKEIMEYIK